MRASSDKYNFCKAKEWYKYPIRDEKSDDIWSENLNAAKRRKCIRDEDDDSDIDEDKDVIFVDAKRDIIEVPILTPEDSSENESK